jgi:hypothetical protein
VPVRLSKHTSLPPEPTGSAPIVPRTTSYCVAWLTAAQRYVVLSASAAMFWISGGIVPLMEAQPVVGSHVSVVHEFPSSQLTEGPQMSTQ